MLEEVLVMEKKPNGRSNQPPAKAGTEGKKNGETTTFGKYSRRREPSTSNNGKNEPGRKANPFKQGKFSDKRPRPRSQYYSGGKQETKVDELLDVGPEFGSVTVPGKKKQNLNHLLNFTLAPRPAIGSGSSSLQPRERSGNWLATHKHKYNKEQFLQANCQFIVKEGVDYGLHLGDPDILVDWTNIEQIRLRSTERLSCPICLDTPVAAKMTRCGHVYCWSCILHYLALSDKTWRKCPICYESVHKRDLKSVVTVANTPCRVGDQFTFRLMKRERGTLLAVPVGEDDVSRQWGVPLAVKEPVLTTAYSKLLLATVSDVKYVLNSERLELEAALKAAAGEPELCFIEQALELLLERERGVEGNEELSREKGKELSDQSPGNSASEVESTDDEARQVAVDSSPEEEMGLKISQELEEDSDEALPNVLPEDVETESQVAGQKPFYFYQAADGQNVFLTALNLRMLETQFGGLAHAPHTITGSVLEKEAGSMTRELRNRLRSLSHLPLTAAFELLELDLSGWVSYDVLEAFAEPLRIRQERRRRREREERRRDRRITKETGLQWGQQPAARIRLDSAKHFPRCGEEDPPLGCIPSPNESLSESRSNSLSSLASGGLDHLDLSEQPAQKLTIGTPPSQDSAGPSFAQMLKAGANKGNGYRRAAWGRPAPVEAVSDLRDADDEYASAPRYQQSFSDAIAQALERADLNLDEGGNSKKKKKRKQKLLFSSGMAFVKE